MANKMSEKSKKYAAARAHGASRAKSAIIAGVVPPGTSLTEANNIAFDKEKKSTAIQQQIRHIKNDLMADMGVSKREIVEMLMTAAQMAKVAGEAMSLVAAAREIGKMLGFYAPITHVHDVNKEGLKHLLEEMSDEDLYKLSKAKTIDGEATRIETAPDQKGLAEGSEASATEAAGTTGIRAQTPEGNLEGGSPKES